MILHWLTGCGTGAIFLRWYPDNPEDVAVGFKKWSMSFDDDELERFSRDKSEIQKIL